MSHYPYGYGFQGQQPPQQQYPYQPYGAYSAPGFGAQPPSQPPPPATPDYYTATQSSYDFNANNIPGLGTPLTAPQFPVPFGGPWEQGGYGTSAPPGPYPTYNSSTFVPVPPASPPQANPQGHVPVPSEPQPNPEHRPEPLHPHSKAQAQEEQVKEQLRQPPKDIDSQDEGEISDGQFDDLYEDVYDQPSAATQKTKAASHASSDDQAASSSDQGANFYDTEMEEVSPSNDRPKTVISHVPSNDEISREQGPMRTERERSGSYSPYLSPREIEPDGPKAEARAVDAQGRAQVQDISTGPKKVAVSSAGSSSAFQAQDIDGNQSKDGDIGLGQSGSGSIALESFRSLPEAQNEAKKAILRLLPHGVKYQTYIDEGFDEKVIKGLFTQLNLAPATPNSASSAKPSEAQENKIQDQAAPQSQTSQADAMAKKQEERKDKIARRLAEKKAKAAAEATAGPKAPPAATSTATSAPSTPATKPTTQAQKTLLLQQKMEALRKAREARTQQASQKPGSPKAPNNGFPEKPTPIISTQGPAVAPQTSAGFKPVVHVSTPSAAMPTPQDRGSQPASRPTSGFQSPALPGLSNKPINHRKRPVAADFVDYPRQAVKRPLLPSRQASSLVISVSDDEEEEDDDDDVDMEVDSPTEESPAPTQQAFSLPRRGPSVRDFPPLSNSGPPRHLSSPAPGTPVGKTGTVDLKAMEKAIADYKRKIQEAEARAKVKPNTGSSTPQSPSAGGVTPTEQATKSVVNRVVSTGDVDDKNGPSAQLLQEAEAAKIPTPPVLSPAAGHSRIERRVRTASAQSPRLSTKLQSKIAELKRMEEERRRLQAEIDAELAQQQLADEEDADELDSDSAGELASETSPADRAATSSGEPGQDESEPTALDGRLQSLPIDLESLSGKSASEIEPSTSTLSAPAPAAVDDVGSNPPSTQEPTYHDDASSLLAGQPAEVLAAIASSAPTEEPVAAAADSSTSDDYEPPDAAGIDRSTIDSPPFSPAPAENVANTNTSGGESQEVTPPMVMPTQISTATIPNDDPTIEARADFFAHPSARTADVSREVYIVSSTH
ncbi:hypothetical protein diail_3738 [Diaporthe ilicicola]|nr:hypothetical protein diail_3738 [Diaporthe ilicicola]